MYVAFDVYIDADVMLMLILSTEKEDCLVSYFARLNLFPLPTLLPPGLPPSPQTPTPSSALLFLHL